MERVKCSACGYEWRPRVEEPKACPRCKGRRDKPQRAMTAQKQQKEQ